MLDPKEYTSLALSTKSPFFYNKSVDVDLLHAIMGLVTESGELEEAISENKIDEVNIKEEFGDLLWYLAIGYNSLGEDISERLQDYTGEDLRLEISNCIKNAGHLMDVCKRAFYYGREEDEFGNEKPPVDNVKVLYHLDEILFAVIRGLSIYKTPIEEVMDKNIRKLEKRFPNKFSTGSAYIRDIRKEREILEGRSIEEKMLQEE